MNAVDHHRRGCRRSSAPGLHVVPGHPRSGPLPQPGSRINIVGPVGAGKTTFGKALAECLGIPFVELDSLSWLPNWVTRPDEEMRGLVEERTREGAWVVDGNYSKLRDIVWARADTVVWLDYGFPRAFGQLLWRTIRRSVTGEELWQGNRESFRRAFFLRDSILLWAIRTHRRRRRLYPRLLARPENAHLRLVRLRSPRDARRWLARLSARSHPV